MGFFIFFLLLISTFGFNLAIAQQVENSPEIYIVHVKSTGDQFSTQLEDVKSWYQSFLPARTVSSNEQSQIVYSYHNVFTGFAARLTPEEVKEMEKKVGFVSAHPQTMLSLHTTHSPNFLGLSQNLGFWRESNYGRGVIIGVLDTGVLPTHPSFSDEGMPPPPTKWRGRCEFRNATCNNKIIGARNFASTSTTPFDEDGHGTHTAGTAAGSFVRGANVFGNANGTAVGIAPLAHLAIYKVCSPGCGSSDILAAMDAAIDDGVDVLSLSLGGPSRPFHDDSVALGAFSAIQRGIFVSASANNLGPSSRSLSNEAPWILTVGASTVDRSIRATAQLGNMKEFNGESLFQPNDFPPAQLPLVYLGTNNSDTSARSCSPASLNRTDVRGKVVFCEFLGGTSRVATGQNVKDAGGAAMILMNPSLSGYSTRAEAHVLPATHVSYTDGLQIISYINSTSNPTSTILFRGTIIGDRTAPFMSSTSSRGPSRSSPGILKPDIIGPGVNILAAWPTSVENKTGTNLTFNIISGTSMSCPHLSGVVALLKSTHPDWSPAAIKSAIMTTADVLNLDGNPILDERHLPATVFATGSGHVNPSRANDPGLIYDLRPEDYFPYLCGLNYTNDQIEGITQTRVNCSQISSVPEAELNYPSFAIGLGLRNQTYTRNVTNVGEPTLSYVAEISSPQGVIMRVEPARLNFSRLNQTMSYRVTFRRSVATVNASFTQGFIKWNSAKYSVRSPIVVTFQ